MNVATDLGLRNFGVASELIFKYATNHSVNLYFAMTSKPMWQIESNVFEPTKYVCRTITFLNNHRYGICLLIKLNFICCHSYPP